MPSAIGTMPRMQASEVIKIGRNLVRPASSTASRSCMPSRRRKMLV
jgi:hypothetical protein